MVFNVCCMGFICCFHFLQERDRPDRHKDVPCTHTEEGEERERERRTDGLTEGGREGERE